MTAAPLLTAIVEEPYAQFDERGLTYQEWAREYCAESLRAAWLETADDHDVQLYDDMPDAPWMRSSRTCERCGYDARYDPQTERVRCYGGGR